MDIPAHAREERVDVLYAAIREIGFGTLVTVDGTQAMLTHLPMMLRETAMGPVISGRVARAHPQWERAGSEGVASFVGPSFYVSPNYYASLPIRLCCFRSAT